MKIQTAALILSMLVARTATGGAWYDGDVIAPDRPHQKAKDGFGAQLLLTTNPSFFSDWASPSPPNLEIARDVTRDDIVYSVLIYFGAGKNQANQSHVTFRGTVTDPEGAQIDNSPEVRVISGPNSAGPYDLGLSDGHVTIRFTDANPNGTYTLRLSVTDHVKNVTLDLEQSVELQQQKMPNQSIEATRDTRRGFFDE